MKQFYIGLLAMAALSCQMQEPAAVESPVSASGEQSQTFVPGIAVMEFDESLTDLVEEDLKAGSLETKSARLNAAFGDLGVAGVRRVFPDAGEFEPRTRREGMHRFYRVEFTQETPVTKAVANLSGIPGVLSVRPVRMAQKRSFDDPLFPRQWHYVNNVTAGADINVQSVWNQFTKGRNNVVVCVVDEPVDANHEDLKGNLWHDAEGHTGYNFPRNSWDMTIRPEFGNGDFGHGTHVAGTISAVNNNGAGLCGIAGGDAAQGIQGVLLQSAAIFSGTAMGHEDDCARAIKWGADHGAVISQNSWGVSADLDGDGTISDEEIEEFMQLSIDEDPVLKAAIDYFIKYAGCDNDGNQLPDSPMKGGVVVFAAGNDDVGWDFISTYEPIIAVGAFNAYGNKSGYSNWGDWVDIAAPGGSGGASTCIWSTLPTSVESSGYAGQGWMGTSMACPHVSGVAALIVSYFGGPGFTQEICKDILTGGLGNRIGGDKPIGRKLDAEGAFKYGIRHYGGDPEEQKPPVIVLSERTKTVRAHQTVTVGVTATDPNGDKFTLTCRPGSDALEYFPEQNLVKITGKNAPAGTYEAVFVATDETGLSSEAVLTYTLLPNHPPRLAGTAQDRILAAVETVSVPFQDEDGETLQLSVQTSNQLVVMAEIVGGSQVKLTPGKNGIATIIVTATDTMGATASARFQVAVRVGVGPMEIYPVPATTDVYFWPESQTQQTLKITLYSATGSRVRTVELPAGLFFPAAMDISTLAPGKYTAEMEYGGTTMRGVVVKI